MPRFEIDANSGIKSIEIAKDSLPALQAAIADVATMPIGHGALRLSIVHGGNDMIFLRVEEIVGGAEPVHVNDYDLAA